MKKVINWGSHDCQTQTTYPNLFIQSYDCGNFVSTKRIIIHKMNNCWNLEASLHAYHRFFCIKYTKKKLKDVQFAVKILHIMNNF